MRLPLLVLALLATSAAADPLWDAEVRSGYGIAVGGGGGMASRRATPLTLAGIVSIAVNETPPLSGYGGVVVETIDRNSVGALFGVKLSPQGSHLRFTGGGTYVFAPYTLWGATASAGACTRFSPSLRFCGDAVLTAYFAGTDLAPGHTVTQLQLAIGVVFDAP